MLTLDSPLPVESGDIPDPDALSAYLESSIEGLDGPIAYFKFSAGNSNLTYLIKAAERELILKREPRGAKAKSAHDMRREFRVLAALHPVFALAPRPVLLCDDLDVLGGAFFVMDRVRGAIVRQADAAALSDDQARAQFMRLLSAQAELHALDVCHEPLAALGRPAGYRRRQVDGWTRRLADARTPETPSAGDIETWLLENLPRATEDAALVHNDFKLDNLVWDLADPTRLVAVLDWEMATLGDPLMDVGVTLSFWPELEDPPRFRGLRSMPTDRQGVPGRRGAWRRYLAERCLQSDGFSFYLGFGFYRRAVIEQQKFARYRSGQTSDPRYAQLDAAVRVLLDMARRQIEEPPS